LSIRLVRRAFPATRTVHHLGILAAVTALPEISSGIQAVRLGAVGLAMSDIYGGNAM
jgi:Ca2+/Na+ antiporter